MESDRRDAKEIVEKYVCVCVSEREFIYSRNAFWPFYCDITAISPAIIV